MDWDSGKDEYGRRRAKCPLCEKIIKGSRGLSQHLHWHFKRGEITTRTIMVPHMQYLWPDGTVAR